ncbi:hypothetical protein C0J52_21688 [Blattella germanica]|nr:hypothetical protein C0J52_21688 [Blattella germanica]
MYISSTAPWTRSPQSGCVSRKISSCGLGDVGERRKEGRETDSLGLSLDVLYYFARVVFPLARVLVSWTPATARWQSHQPVAAAAAAGAAPGAADAPPPPHQRHFSVSFAVMNNYQAAAAAAAQGFGPPASPHAAAAAAAANSRGGFPPANSPGPIDMYSSSAADSVAGYVQAASPQPSGFPTIAVSLMSHY